LLPLLAAAQDSEIPATWLMVDIPDQSIQDAVLLHLR
jgi:hypothetical protein